MDRYASRIPQSSSEATAMAQVSLWAKNVISRIRTEETAAPFLLSTPPSVS